MKDKYKILVVDDEPLNQLLIKVILEKNIECNLIEVYDGIDAICLMRKNKFNLILMDIRMPIIDGIEATKIIKKIYPYIPIICISAFTPDIIDSNIFDDVVNKPISSDILIDKVKNLLN